MGANLSWDDISNKLKELKSNGYTEADLAKLVADASVRVEGAPDNATSLLYSGEINPTGQSGASEKSYKVAQQLVKDSGIGKYVIIDDTPAGRLLFDDGFQSMYKEAIRTRLAATQSDFANVSIGEQDKRVAIEFNKKFFNAETVWDSKQVKWVKSETRLPYNANDLSFWDNKTGDRPRFLPASKAKTVVCPRFSRHLSVFRPQ